MRIISEATLADLDELVHFATPFVQNELSRYPALPAPVPEALAASFQRRLDRGAGVVARDGGSIVGNLLGFGPIPDFRPDHAGVYGPLASCLTVEQDADSIFTTMLTAFGHLPKFEGVQIASFTGFSSHRELNASLVQNGFGLRCADAIVATENVPQISDCGFAIEEVAIADAVSLQEVKHTLAVHIASSPVFQDLFAFTPEFIAWKTEERQSVHFAARDGDLVVGFIEATTEGENFLASHDSMRNICGAGVLPEYRGRGIMRSLLTALANHYRQQGVTSLGVDYETQNPNARGFWESVFAPYTWSWERHYDRSWGDL